MSEIIFSWLYSKKLMGFIRLLLPLSTVHIFLSAIHILRQNFPVKIRYCKEKLFYIVPKFLVPWTLIINKCIIMKIGKQVKLFIPVSYFLIIIENIFFFNCETWISINIRLIFNIVPSSYFRKILFVKKKSHQ